MGVRVLFVPRTFYSARFSVPCLSDVHLNFFDVHLNIFVFALLYIYFLHGLLMFLL
jgi:hypothetical protein